MTPAPCSQAFQDVPNINVKLLNGIFNVALYFANRILDYVTANLCERVLQWALFVWALPQAIIMVLLVIPQTWQK